MRYVLTAILALAPVPALTCQSDLECHLLKYLAPGSVPADQLALEIERLSSELNLSPISLAALVLHESAGRPNAYNAVSNDHGILQINSRTAIDLKLSAQCLYDWRCNLRAGAKLFAAHRPCLYNLGRYRRLEGKYISMCNNYESRLAAFHY